MYSHSLPPSLYHQLGEMPKELNIWLLLTDMDSNPEQPFPTYPNKVMYTTRKMLSNTEFV